MTKIQVQSEIDAQGLLIGISQMPLNELEYFVREINALFTRRKAQDKGNQEKNLLSKINQAVLPQNKAERYAVLIQKLEADTISDTEHSEFMDLITEEEAIRNDRVKYLIELSQLRNITLPQLMDSLGLNRAYNG